jgi:hypothetical protein
MSMRHSFLLGPGRWTAIGHFSGAVGSHPGHGETAVSRNHHLLTLTRRMETRLRAPGSPTSPPNGTRPRPRA